MDADAAGSAPPPPDAPQEAPQAEAAAPPPPQAQPPPPSVAELHSLMTKLGDLQLDEKYALVRSIGEECIQEEELRNLLAKKPQVVAYDGFEPSGRMHIAQGVMKALNVNKLTRAGVTFTFWVADWFALMNNKMGGDLAKIQTTGRYMVEVWKAVGMNLEGDRVRFVSSSEEINARAGEYWPLVLDIARRNSLARVTRCSQIMGRSETDELAASQIFYPCMQCADIFFLQADICQLGMDQRKVNMLAREYCDTLKRKNKPVILSHVMLMGLKQGQEKMSKSDPDSAIWMEDSADEVRSKIRKAYCPPAEAAANPVLQYVRYLTLPWFGSVTLPRSSADGAAAPHAYTDYAALEADYVAGLVHPGDLKAALTEGLNAILQPVRDHFVADKEAAELLRKVKSYKITR